MSTPTPTPRTYAAKIKSGFAAVPDQFYEFARTLETELSALRAEVERLRSDRDCEKRLRKDADEFRENAIERAQRAEAEVKRLGHLEAVLRSCAFDKDGTAWKTVCGWWSKKYDAVERQMSDNATRAELADAELATERARLDWVFHNCKVTSDDFTVHDREDLGVAMKEHAK